VPREEERKPLLVRVQDTFKENPLLFIILLILGVVIIFLIARKRGIAEKPKRIVEKHFFDQPRAEAPKAEAPKT